MSKKLFNIPIATLCFIFSVAATDIIGQSASANERFKTRCGWLDNPTPANYSFYDKDGEWTIGVQGGYQVEDFSAPAFKRGQWVNFFGGSYGYGCACFQMTTDKESGRVLEIRKSYARPLSACRKDKALRKWKDESE